MSVDFESNRLICVHYPPGAGGKFLMNCLALTNDVEFQHKDLLNHFTDSTQRYNFLLNKLENASGQWNDLNLGCIEMFYVAPYYTMDATSARQILGNESVLLKLSESDRYWCMVAHQDIDIDDLYRKVWPNCRIIRFINYKEFLISRNCTYKDLSDKSYPGEYLWDVSVAYSSESNFSYQLNKLCDWLNVPRVELEYLHKLYKVWIKKINL